MPDRQPGGPAGRLPDRSVTLQTVASAAQVHPATASRALNPATRDLVNPQTAARIEAAARELGYRANPMARGLRTNRSMTVGVLLPDLQNPFYPPMVRGIDDELSPMGYVPLIANTDNNSEREKAVWDGLRARQVDGIIAATARVDDPFIRAVVADAVKIVLVSRIVDGLPVPAVVFDDAGGMRLAVEHLHALGHRAIGHLAGPQDNTVGLARTAGFHGTCARLGIGTDPVVDAGDITVEAGERACTRLLDQEPVTAIVAGNDLIALGCLAVFARRGLSCPQDVSLVGINNMRFLDRIDPPLTSVSTPKYEMGRLAARQMLRVLGGEPGTAVEQVAAGLVVRASTAPPPPR